MDEIVRLVDQAISLMDEHPHLEALAIIVAALLAGYLVEILTTRVLLGLARKTETDLDDAIVAAIRRPLFASVVLAGGWLALQRLGPSEIILSVARGLLVTVAVLYWSGAAMRIGKPTTKTHLRSLLGWGGDRFNRAFAPLEADGTLQPGEGRGKQGQKREVWSVCGDNEV